MAQSPPINPAPATMHIQRTRHRGVNCFTHARKLKAVWAAYPMTERRLRSFR
jgi:hypothetical protein